MAFVKFGGTLISPEFMEFAKKQPKPGDFNPELHINKYAITGIGGMQKILFQTYVTATGSISQLFDGEQKHLTTLYHKFSRKLFILWH